MASFARDRRASSSMAAMARNGLELCYATVVHRHGSRTPVTPLLDVDFWASTLPDAALVAALEGPWASVRRDRERRTHPAAGSGVFGRLDAEGVTQLRDVGWMLRRRYVGPGKLIEDGDAVAARIRYFSTDFSRTLLSARCCLAEFLGPGDGAEAVKIDARGWERFVPDPEPRRYHEQAVLEARALEQLPPKGADALRLQKRASAALAPLVDAAKAFNVGIGADDAAGALSWTKLAEVARCLADHGRLPAGLDDADAEHLADVAAAEWRSVLGGSRRLRKLAADAFVSEILDAASAAADEFRRTGAVDERLRLVSGHDSVIIMLMAAFDLEAPSAWPDYASVLEVQVYVDRASRAAFLRFALDGECLRIANTDFDVAPLAEVRRAWGPRLAPTT